MSDTPPPVPDAANTPLFDQTVTATAEIPVVAPTTPEPEMSPFAGKVALVSVHGVITSLHDNEDEAYANWTAESSHVTEVRVPRKVDA